MAIEPIVNIFLLPKNLTTNAPRTEQIGHRTPIMIVPTSGEIGKPSSVYSSIRMRSRVMYTVRMPIPLCSLKNWRMQQIQVALAYFGPQTASLKVTRLASFDVVLFKFEICLVTA